MDADLRRAVFRLCQNGAAHQAVTILRRTGRAPAPDAEPHRRRAWLRLLGYALLAAGQPRSAAAAYWRALRLKRGAGAPLVPADWAPLAAAYRELWRSTGHTSYLRHYLRFTGEQADQAQTRLAREALQALRGPGRISARSAH